MKLINGWTKTSVLDAINDHVTPMGAISNEGVCSYQTEDRGRCAVGAFLPDNFEGFECEGEVNILLTKYPELEYALPFNLKNLSALQTIHDKAAFANKKAKGLVIDVKDVLILFLKHAL